MQNCKETKTLHGRVIKGTRYIAVLSALLASALAVSGADFYASPTGNPNASGNLTSPWDLQTAINGGQGGVQPGDTIWLRGGTYQALDIDGFQVRVRGTSDKPIVIRNHNREHVVIDAPATHCGVSLLQRQAEYVWLWGVEVTDASPMGFVGQQDVPPAGHGICIDAVGIKVVDSPVHSVAGPALASQALLSSGPVISNVQATNISSTSATITWSTDVPATSQVILLVNGLYQPLSRYPEPQDSSLTTNHSVTIANLLPATQYTLSVVSEDANGNFSVSADINNTATNSPSFFTTFTTNATDGTALYDYRLDTDGPRNVYVGSDLYLQTTYVALAGLPTHIALASVSGLPADINAHLICIAWNPNEIDSMDSFIDANGLSYCYNDNQYGVYHMMVRLRTSSITSPGSYTVTAVLQSGGVQRPVRYTFNVLPAPLAVNPVANSYPPIPNLAKWQDTMLTLGQKWCNPTEVMEFGWEGQVWYYDGARVFYQLGDYTQDASTWTPCALNINNQYRDYVNSNNGSLPGWRVFPHGLAMTYWRNGDLQSQAAAIALATNMHNNSLLTWSNSRPFNIRETAYMIDSFVKMEQLGQPREIELARAVDFALGDFDQLFVSEPMQFDQPFFDGLMAEALIQYYSLTKDPRVPPAIKQMLDWIWNNSYDQTQHKMIYNHLGVPQLEFTESNLLVAPAYAWYWSLTGDNTYLVRGDDMFAHALDDDISFMGKQFSQNYRWSFDYVGYRSGTSIATSDPAANIGLTSAPSPTALAAPANPSPASAATGVAVIPTLSWSASANATSYDIYLGTSANAPLAGSTVGLSFSPSALSGGTTYSWRVAARNGSASTFSTTWIFTTGTPAPANPLPPGAAANLTPVNGATGVSLTPTLTWAAADNTTSYDVYLGTSNPPALAGSTTSLSYSAPTLTSRSPYYWKIVAKNSGGSTSSATWSFTTGASAPPSPGAAANLTPANGATAVSLTPTLTWAAADNTTSYDVYLGTSSPPALAGSTTSLSYSPAALSNSTTYYWKIVAKNSGGSTSSASWSFTTAAPAPPAPGAAANLTPANGATGVSLTPTLTWAAASNATSYDVYLGTSNPPALAGSTTSLSYSAPTLSSGVTYYWKIVAKNSGGSTSSATWSFTTAASAPPAPGAAANLTPANGATGASLTPTLTWAAASNATSYDVYLGTSNPPGLTGSTTSLSYSAPTLSSGVTYYWKIVAKNSGASTPSATWSFTTAMFTPTSNHPPGAAANLSPANGATGVSLTPTLAWAAADYATSYDVYLGTSNPPALTGSTTSLSYSAPTLSSGVTYYWKIVAKNSGASTPSATWSFTTAVSTPNSAHPPGAAGNPSPANGATAVSLTPTLTWAAAGNATYYDVYLGRSNPPGLVGSTTGRSYNPSTLSSSATYYWKIVANNSAGSTSSATWSFTTPASAP